MNFNGLLNAAKVSVGDAALYAALGFAVVILGIAFLIFVIWLVGKFFTKKKAAPAPVVQEKPAIASVNDEDISEETVAVIMAALTAYYESVNTATNSNCEFIVKRIKRI